MASDTEDLKHIMCFAELAGKARLLLVRFIFSSKCVCMCVCSVCRQADVSAGALRG